ncbi:MAG: transposase [Thermodesulfovibrionales bacterium]
MARQLRIEYEGAFYHVTSRGNRREQIFWDEHDRLAFKNILVRTKERYGYLLHAFVLMDNHYHLLIETPHANIQQIMHNINTSYTVWVNRRQGRVGHLFQGRYKAFVVEKESYLLELGRYLHLNPVRAGVVKLPGEYQWSSYGEYLRGGSGMLTDTDSTLSAFSRRRAEAAERYKEFVERESTGKSPLQEAEGIIVGGTSFKDSMMKQVKGIADTTELPDAKRIEPKNPIEDIVRAVARHYGATQEDLLNRKRAWGRQRGMAVYLCTILSGRKNAEIGKLFGITLQGVTNAVRRIGTLREKDKKLDNELEEIKSALSLQSVLFRFDP